jgi:hypothetical protein
MSFLIDYIRLLSINILENKKSIFFFKKINKFNSLYLNILGFKEKTQIIQKYFKIEFNLYILI